MPLPKIAIIRNAESEKISLPRYGNPVGTSMTLLSAHTDSIKIAPNHYEVIGTGLAIALPIGLEAQVRSLKESTQSGVYVLNAPLTIDAFDRQEIKVCLYNASSESVIIKYNDPIALLVFSPVLRVEWDDMTEKRQTQAAKTEAFMQRMNETQEPQTFVCDEFEPIEEEMASEPSTLPETPASETLQEQKNPDDASDSYIEEQKTSIEPPAVVKEFEETDSYIEEQKNPDNTSDSYIEEQKTPVEPPAIVKEFEETDSYIEEQKNPDNTSDSYIEEQKNPDNTSDSYIEEQKTPVEPPAIVKEFEETDSYIEEQKNPDNTSDSYIEEQKNPDNTSDSYIEEQKTPIEPPAIVKEFEEMEKNFYDTQEEKSNEN